MCGIIGAIGFEDAAFTCKLMGNRLQHRGQEAAGITSWYDGKLRTIQNFGLVDEVFNAVRFHDPNPERRELPGRMAVGHLRYSTSGDSRDLENVQPFVARVRDRPVALVHNGNLTNYEHVRSWLVASSAIFQSTSDTEVFLHLLARIPGEPWVQRLVDVFNNVEGAYSLIFLSEEGLTAVVDPNGFRPLCMGRYKGGYVFASEDCALQLIKATRIEHLPPGTILTVDRETLEVRRTRFGEGAPCRHCSFERVYFSRPDSHSFDLPVYGFRSACGERLAVEHPANVDLVSAVPDSSNVAALAYARALGVPFAFPIIRDHYTGRTFITPSQPARELGVRMKHNVVEELVNGKRVAIIDDSLVRGTTMKQIAQMLRDAGAREIHLRIASPPVIHPCRWGIDTPERKKLIAAQIPVERLAPHLDVDSIGFISLDGFRRALGDADKHCTTCFTGVLPT